MNISKKLLFIVICFTILSCAPKFKNGKYQYNDKLVLNDVYVENPFEHHKLESITLHEERENKGIFYFKYSKKNDPIRKWHSISINELDSLYVKL